MNGDFSPFGSISKDYFDAEFEPRINDIKATNAFALIDDAAYIAIIDLWGGTNAPMSRYIKSGILYWGALTFRTGCKDNYLEPGSNYNTYCKALYISQDTILGCKDYY